ncbi:hypothetical protein PENSTE_c019G10055 [Penicillium steckii]|uniref:Methyltransferase domain-containing protein n=1 Tax=Penicillium steckii TaxID=303698 RepID=A0A1V6SVR9_9EURO|nr:hypothetical protein PENSTE_c019G10055 [Penicillium steckii]
MSNEALEPDPNIFSDEAYDSDGSQSTCSVSSSIFNGLIENGRSVPSDELQFETYEAGYHILDVGTGQGTWAIEVADKFPSGETDSAVVSSQWQFLLSLSLAIVRGVDLYPPPATWVPPNCILEIDDISRDWTWKDPFDLIHIRIFEGAFTLDEYRGFYKQCFQNTRPGGWIEQLEIQPIFCSQNDSLPEDSSPKEWSRSVFDAAARSGRPMELYENCVPMIEEAGFVETHVHETKWPIGAWPKDPMRREAGLINLQHWQSGLEGYSMHLLTNYGVPTPWSWEEVMAFVAKLRNDLANDHHQIYHFAKRVWARKPSSDEKAVKPSMPVDETKSSDSEGSVTADCP